MSTSTLGGHVNTISEQVVDDRRRRRLHSDEFKANAVAACMRAGMSMANGINANLLRRWVREAEARSSSDRPDALPASKLAVTETPAAFVPMQLPVKAPTDIRIELHRGATSITMTWPTDAATQCAAWMRELLR